MLAAQPLSGFGQTTSVRDIQCVPQPLYGYRTDGQPGRELRIRFTEGKLTQKAILHVTANGMRETTTLLPSAQGDTVCTVLLPHGVGVDKAAKVGITFIQGNQKIQKNMVIPPMRYWTIYLYNHAHVDIGYTNTQKNIEILHKTNVLEGIKLAEATKNYPAGSQFKWNPEVTWPLERLWVSMPAERENVLQAIRNDQLCVDAAYLNLNTSACADEELFHAFDFSRKMQKLTNKPMDVFQQFDIPGITWGLIPVMAQEGVKYIISWPNTDRAGNAHKNRIDQYPFWWVGPDGKSKVLFFQPGGYANSGSMNKGAVTGRPWFGQRDPLKVPAFIKTGSANVDFTAKLVDMEKAGYPYDFLTLSWSLWDNNPLDADIPDAVKKWNETHAYPKIIIAGGHEIMRHIEEKYGDKLPVVKGDYTEYWTDGLGTAANLTAMNRNAKERLIQAEKLWTMLNPGQAAPRDEFDEAWRYTSLGSEHTWCFENPAESYFQDAIFKIKQSYFHQADERSRALYDEALAPATDKSDGGMGPAEGPAAGGIAVFNTNSWKHSGLITLSKAESMRGDRVQDDSGVEVPAQRLSTGELVFMANDVPALGSSHYRVTKGKSSFADGCSINGNVLENKQLRVVVDSKTGNVSQLIDLKTGYNYADEKVNGGLNAFRWLPANIDAAVADSNICISVVEQGPLVTELNVKSEGKGCRSVSRSVRLVAGQPWVEIANVVDKLPLTSKDGIHFGFGFNVSQSTTRVDIPWGIMEVEKDQWLQANRNWLTLQRWLDVSNDKKGVTWCSLDAPLFEYGKMTANIALGWGGKGPWITKLEPSSTIYSWVMNNHWHTNFPLTQEGPVSFRYRIMPHGAFDVVEANRFGMEQAQPLVHVAANKDPKVSPFVDIDNPKVVVSILKSTGDSRSVILRLRSLSDKAETATLRFAREPKSARLYNLKEDSGELPNNRVTMLPYGIATIMIEL